MVSDGISIIICTVAAAVFGAVLFPVKTDEEVEEEILAGDTAGKTEIDNVEKSLTKKSKK